MKIMILANSDGGLYKFRRELLERLLKEHEVMICLPDGDYIETMARMGCQFIPCNMLDRRGTNPLTEIKLISFYKRIFS